MIGLVTAALAAVPDIDVFFEIPALASVPATYTSEDEDGIQVYRDPRLALRLGLGGVVLLPMQPQGRTIIAGGVNLWSAVWEHEPEEVGVAVWEEWVGAGWRWEPSQPEARIQGWWEIGGAVYVQQVLPTYFAGILVATPGAWFAGGVTLGTGAVRPQIALRTGFVHPGASATGGTSNTPDDFLWTWNAGRVYFDAQVGAAFR